MGAPFDFPNAPVVNQIFTPPGGPSYTWNGVAWMVATAVSSPTAEARNRIVNGAMQHSQENGNTAGTATGYYFADQWLFNGIPGALAYSYQRVQSVTPNGSVNRLRTTVTTGGTVVAGNVMGFVQPIEGLRVDDFLFGLATARQLVLRFGFRAPAGTYNAYIRNGATNRSYLTPFTISAAQANTDTLQTFVIPGDTTGTWPVDNTVGMYLGVTVVCGATYQGVLGWQAGNFLGLPTTGTTLATNAIFELFDVGLYLDPQNTGLAPPWMEPDYASELLACLRYWNNGYSGWNGQTTSGTTFSYTLSLQVPMRNASFTISLTPQATAGFPTARTSGALSAKTLKVYAAANASGIGYMDDTYIVNARM